MAINLTRTIPSSEIVKTGWVKFVFNIGNIDMRTAKKLGDLEAAVRQQMHIHGWTAKKNEEEICNAVVRTMHDSKFFDGFEPAMQSKIDSYKSYADKRGDILAEKVPFNQNTLVELNRAEKAIASSEKEMTGSWIKERLLPRKLQDFKRLICHEEAPVAGYVLEKLGVHNDVCYGVGEVRGGSYSNATVLHCFLQCESGHIVDATSKQQGYYRALTSGKISRGQIVLIDNGSQGGVVTYGGGRASFSDIVKIVASGFKSNYLYAARDKAVEAIEILEPTLFMKLENKRLAAIRAANGGTLEPERFRYTSRQIHDADLNHDGLLSKEEIDNLHKLKMKTEHGHVNPSHLPRMSNVATKN